jgi:hypothetical protein
MDEGDKSEAEGEMIRRGENEERVEGIQWPANLRQCQGREREGDRRMGCGGMGGMIEIGNNQDHEKAL